MNNPTQRPDGKNGNEFEDFDTPEVPTYSRNTNTPLASDAPTTVFSPAAARGVSDFDAGTVPAETPQQPTVEVPADQAQTQQLSFQSPPQQTPAVAAAVAMPTLIPEAETTQLPQQTAVETTDARRGTIDFGIFIIRFCVGLYLILDALGVFFQLGSDPGLKALEQSFNGYAYPNVLAVAIPSMQLVAGVFLLLGLITPIAVAIGTIAAAFTFLHSVHASDVGVNIFNMDAKVALSALLLGALVGLQFTGPGKISFDFGRRWARRPLYSSWIFAVLGIGGAVLVWWFGAGINPLS